MSNTSVTGSVKFFNAAKGFGFIAPEDGGKDVFVPAASIAASGLSRLKAGQRVSFELEPDAKGPKAVKLAVLEEAPTAIAPPAPQPSPVKQPTAKKPVTVYSDSATANGAVEDVMEALMEAGETPRLVTNERGKDVAFPQGHACGGAERFLPFAEENAAGDLAATVETREFFLSDARQQHPAKGGQEFGLEIGCFGAGRWGRGGLNHAPSL